MSNLLGVLYMRNTLKVWLASAMVCGSFASFAQTPAAAAAPAAAPAAAVMQNFVCKDGTSVSAETSKGTCKGHKGIDKAATAKLTGGSAPATPAAAAAPAAKAAAPAAAATTAAKAAPAATPAAPGGGAGQVWVNEGTKVYHCQGDRYYGKTKTGKYMSEADAKAAGAHAANNKACS